MKFNELKPGTVFRFNTKPGWWNNTMMTWKQSMVAMGNGTWRYLKHPDVYAYKHDDIEVLGEIAGDLTHGKEWKPTTEPAQPQPSVMKIGLIFFFNETPDRWDGKIPTNTLMVATAKYDENSDTDQACHFRALSSARDTGNRQLLGCYDDAPDDITVVGQLPPDQLDATEFKHEFLTTITLIDARPLPKPGETEPQLCVLGTIEEFIDLDGKPHPDDCQSEPPSRNRFVRFLKLIW